MLQPNCDVCGRPATIHHTEIQSGSVVVRHLCQEHGEPVWRAAMPRLGDARSQASALPALAKYWRGLPAARKERLVQLCRLTKGRT